MKKLQYIIFRIVGYKISFLFGDPAVWDRFRWLKKNIQKGERRTLDAGCGSGSFSFHAGYVGNEVVGVSFQEKNNETARVRTRIWNIKNITFKRGDLRELDTMRDELKTFDQIICFETIEHIRNDQKLIKDLVSLLKSNGRLLLTAPYKHYKRQPGDNISETEDGGHMRWGYTHEELAHMLESAGLEVEKKEYLTGPVSQGLVYLTRILSRVNPRIGWLIVFPLRIFQILDRAVMKIVKFPPFTVAIIGKKK